VTETRGREDEFLKKKKIRKKKYLNEIVIVDS
jgi:hypothetical protein